MTSRENDLYREYEYGLLKCAWHSFNVTALTWSVYCLLERHLILTVLLSTHVYKWVPGSCWDNHTKCILSLHYNLIVIDNFCTCKKIQHYTYLHIASFSSKNNSATVEPL